MNSFTLLAVLMACCLMYSHAFMVTTRKFTKSRSSMQMIKADDFKNALVAGLVGAGLVFGASTISRAEIDYEGVKYLGGGEKIDVNNANIRAYLKLPGVYPTIASKITNYGPFKSISDVYNIPGLSEKEKEIIKKYENRFVALDPKPEYAIDKINNGLYR